MIDIAYIMNTQYITNRHITERSNLLLGFLFITAIQHTHTRSRGEAVRQIKKSGDKPVDRNSFTVV